MNEKFPFLKEQKVLRSELVDWSSPELLGTEIEMPGGVFCVDSVASKNHVENQDRWVAMEVGEKKFLA